MNLAPTLRGALLQVRPLRAGDFESLYAVASDPLIWEQHPDKARGTRDGFRRFFDESLATGGALVVIDVATQEIIGSSRYHGYDAGRSEVEIGWTFLARKYWGGRYNGELKRLMLEHAFLFVQNVVFLVDPGNERSLRAVAKIGGRRIGTRTNSSGRVSVVLGISGSEFARAVGGRPPTL